MQNCMFWLIGRIYGINFISGEPWKIFTCFGKFTLGKIQMVMKN